MGLAYIKNILIMKKSKFILFYAGIFLLISCAKNPGGFELTGELENAAGSKLFLLEMTSQDIIPFDSVTVEKNGTFQISGNIDQPRFFVLRENPANQLFLLIHPGEEVSITADLLNLQDTYTVSGSEDSYLVRTLNKHMQKTHSKFDSLSIFYQQNIDNPGIELDSLRAMVRIEFEKVADIQRQFTVDFITRNTSSLASLMAVYQQIDQTNFVLNRPEDFKYFVMVDSVLMSIYPDLDYTKTLNENVAEMLAAINLRDQAESLVGIGAIAPEIDLPNTAGNNVKLSSLRGQYVLLDFWAAWCAPCRHENPYLVRAFEKYQSKGFTIYQVSLDRTREAWLKGIEEDKIGAWHHVSDLLFWNSSVVPLYQIQGIPANFLLDKEGRVIAQDLRGEAIEAKLAEIFN